MHSERLQVLLTPAQRQRLERLARRDHRSMGAVIRDAIDAYTMPIARTRAEALRSLFSQNAPVGDWEQMKAEIELGALGLETEQPR
jgi:predicted transcriptional regulator